MDNREAIQRSLDYIENNLKCEITAGELAERAGFSLYHYYRMFHAAVGMPVMQYILHRRLLNGIYEIHCGSSGIEAALRYGFDTYAGFYKAFRREFGCTPAKFLTLCRAKKPCRVNLTKEEHRMVTRKKAAEILRNWNLETEPVEHVYEDGTGNRRENIYYVGQRYILKFTANLGKLRNHIQLSNALEKSGLCVASSVPTADGRAYVQDGELFFYLTKRLPGKCMRSGDFYEGDTAFKAHLMGKVIGQLHLALAGLDGCADDADLYRTVAQWAMPRIQDVLVLPSGYGKKYLATFGKLYDKLPRQMIHRDPNPGNILYDGTRWGFLDFELSQRNVRIFDPCYAATAILSETFPEGNPGKLNTWLDIYRNIIHGYDSVVSLTDDEKQAIPYVVLAN